MIEYHIAPEKGKVPDIRQECGALVVCSKRKQSWRIHVNGKGQLVIQSIIPHSRLAIVPASPATIILPCPTED